MEPYYNHLTGCDYPQNPKNKVRVIFAINGGGVRSIIPALLCEEIERITQRSMIDLVDCFAGTSAGAMLAVALNVPEEKGSSRPKYTARQVVEFLRNNVGTIFHQSFSPFANIAGLFTSKYSVENLDKALREYYGDMTMSESIKDIIIPSSEISFGGSPWWFSKQKIFNLENENAPPVSEEAARNIRVTEVLKASGSAPYYFPYYSIPLDGQKYHFVDGGCYANNPSAIAISYAHLLYGSKTPLLAGYFGTGAPPRPSTVPNPYFQGGIYWIWNYIATSMSLNSDEACLISKIQIQSELLRRPNGDYFEFQPRISENEYRLDDSSEANMNQLIFATERYIQDNQFKIRNFCNKLLVAKGFDPVPVHSEEDIRHFDGIIDDFEVIEKDPVICKIFC